MIKTPARLKRIGNDPVDRDLSKGTTNISDNLQRLFLNLWKSPGQRCIGDGARFSHREYVV